MLLRTPQPGSWTIHEDTSPDAKTALNSNSPAGSIRKLPGYIPSLDGLRAVSVILVIVGHAALYGPATDHWRLFSSFFLNAEIGVECFFVISGFLITMLLLREHERTAKISLKMFYLRRGLRILPPFYALILVVLLLKYLGGLAIPTQRIWTAATFTYNTVKHPAWGSWWLGHTWSLSVEEQFYLCWPFVLVYLGETRARKAALVLTLSAPVFRVCLVLRHPEFANQISGLLPSRMDALMLGALAALCSAAPVFQRWLGKLTAPLIAIPLAFVVVVSPLLSYYFGNLYLFSVGFTAECTCLLIVLLFVIYNPSSGLGRLLNTRLMVYIGVISYDLYLWQQLFITPKNTTFTGLPGINVLLLCIAAFLSHKCIEVPTRSLSRRLTSRT